MSKIHDWLKYYRASLIDSNRGEKKAIITPIIQRENSFLDKLTNEELINIWDKENESTFYYKKKEITTLINNGIEISEEFILSLADLGENQNVEIKIIKIEIAPIKITSTFEHGSYIGNNNFHYPFWIPAYLTEFGVLLPPKENETPIFLRNYLEPNPRDLPTIATMEKLDGVLKNTEFKVDTFKNYWEDCEHFFKTVTGKSYNSFKTKETYSFAICRLEDSNSSTNILQLYNDLIFDKVTKNKEHKILRKILKEKTEEKNYNLSKSEIYLNENHYGQMSNEFPLSKSQRRAFGEFTSKFNIDVFAINGPPGTGKTTILQNVVANYLVTSVIQKKDMPLLIGCSTNNQAITNILDSMELVFSKDLLTQRWIPNVSSFGLYLASKTKGKDDTSLKYQLTTSSFFDSEFIKELDNKSKIEEYKEFFIEKFKTYFTKENFKENTESETFGIEYKAFIFKKIIGLKDKIDSAIKIARGLIENENLLEKLNFKNKQGLIYEIESIQSQKITNDSINKSIEATQFKLKEKYNSFPFYIKHIPFKRFKTIKINSFKLILQPIINHLSTNKLILHDYYSINSEIDKIVLSRINRAQELNSQENKLTSILNSINKKNEDYQKFIDSWNKKYSAQCDKLLESSKKGHIDNLEKVANRLDISYRYEIFWLSTHYRELEYIQELIKCNSDTSKERGYYPYKTKLKRLAKVTPLFISTFHTLPKFSNYFKYSQGNRFYYDLFDLMIIDEAGQVSPEIAIPSLPIAKKILAVGDVSQIEPIWNISKSVDYKNAQKYKIIRNEVGFENINTLGLTTSNGSLMKIIRKSTPFTFTHKTGEKEKGAYLLEHRRCLDPIIAYSSKYVYKNSLELLVGNNHTKNHNLPPLGYIQINGSSEKHQGSSRKNIKEANVIVAWIIENKDLIEKSYNNPIGKCLAIITPFSAQKILIKNILKKYLDVANDLIVGTVHALQGAERPIILFSAVHDLEDKMLFFDYKGKYNMLNVSLTRAKHSFIVFGNMNIFNQDSDSPSGNLAKILFSKKEYALNDTFIYNSPISYPPNQVERIDTLEHHRNTLLKSFNLAKKEIIIFSPFISIRAIEADAVINLINEAIQRGVKVTILTDKNLDIEQGSLKENSSLGRKAIQNTKATLRIVNGIHNKTICVDENIIIEGSFNWLSATRDTTSPYFRKETSVKLQGGKVNEDIQKLKKLFYIDKLVEDNTV
jgi:superfamily I DNA and/or RNA helicase